MTDYAGSKTFRPISLVLKSGILIQDILGVSSLRTRYTTGTMDSLSDNKVSSIIQYSMSESISELIL